MALHIDYTVTALIAGSRGPGDPGTYDDVLGELAEYAPRAVAAEGHDVGRIRVAITVPAATLPKAVRRAFELFEPVGRVAEIEAMSTSRYEDLHPLVPEGEPHPWHCTCRHCLASRIRHPIATRPHQPF